GRIKAPLDGDEACFHAAGAERQVGRWPPLLIPALEHRGEKIKLGEDVAEARGDHLLALEPAAQGQQRHIDGEREGRGVAGELLVEASRPSRRWRQREHVPGPRQRPRAKLSCEYEPPVPPETPLDYV